MLSMITTRRIVQTFFFLLFIWFCIVATIGESWWQLRGWPVNWFLQLDPLAGLGVLLATHTLYAGLIWGLATLVMTLFLGRFFCGWVCPMGALQQFVGYLGLRTLGTRLKIERNQPHPFRKLKYWLLFFLLSASVMDLMRYLLSGPTRNPFLYGVLFAALIVLPAVAHSRKLIKLRRGAVAAGALAVIIGVLWQWQFPQVQWLPASLQTGLLDPIPLIHRSVNLVLLPLADGPVKVTSAMPRLYEGGGVIGLLFLMIILICLRIPRFYCRFVCPLGALMGLLSRWSLWRIGKTEDRCRECRQCEAHCEGACSPSQRIKIGECVLCLNCMDRCRHGLMGYGHQPSAVGERPGPDLSRRHVLSALAAGLLAAPTMRVGGSLAGNWNPTLVRPPGALPEKDFLARCIKCGQCMRICPTNVIHPAKWQAGLEGLWTPALNFRVGTSGCQHNCVACSHICPTAALRPLSVDERMGRKSFSSAGPLRLGMAFIDHGRCLPWAMDTPCIVCQENCPVSPKAIFTRTEYRPVRNGKARIGSVQENHITIDGAELSPNAFSSGDYFVLYDGRPPIRIDSNTTRTLTLQAGPEALSPMQAAKTVHIAVRLQKPYVDPRQCIGCGVCEHECPVQGQRAVRVSAENETRHDRHRMIVSDYR